MKGDKQGSRKSLELRYKDDKYKLYQRRHRYLESGLAQRKQYIF